MGGSRRTETNQSRVLLADEGGCGQVIVFYCGEAERCRYIEFSVRSVERWSFVTSVGGRKPIYILYTKPRLVRPWEINGCMSSPQNVFSV